MTRVYHLTDPDLPENLNTVRDVFLGKEAAPENLNTREPGEGLHDYFMRKGLKCFCPDCRKKGKNVQPTKDVL